MPSEDIKLPFYMERVKDPREFGGIYVYIVTSSTSRGKTRESYRGGRMRLGEIEFAATTYVRALSTSLGIVICIARWT